jgi:hypothetical protein
MVSTSVWTSHASWSQTPNYSADDGEREDWALLSQQALENAYAEDEPDYSLDAIKEPNPEYERR